MFDRLARIVTAFCFSLLIGVGPAFPQAALLPNAKQTFVDQNGKPLTGGKVYLYVPGTTNLKTTWSDSGETTPNTNPVTLDAAGRAVIYGQGTYQQALFDQNGNPVWSAPTTAWNSAAPSGAGGTDTAPVGTVIMWASFTLPTNWLYANGQAVNRATYPDLMTATTISSTTVSCTSGSAILGGWVDTSQMRIGAPVEASCIPVGSTIASVTNSTTIVINQLATATSTVTATVFPWGNGDGTLTFNVPDLRGRVAPGADTMQAASPGGRLTASTTITTTSGSLTATVASITGIAPNMVVSTANIPAGTTVASINGSVVTFSAAATGSGGGTAATFYAFTSANVPAAPGGGNNTLVTANLPPYTPSGTLSAPTAHVPLQLGGQASSGSSGQTTNSASTSVVFDSPGSFTGTAQGGTSVPFMTVQSSVTFNYIIKAKANTSGAGGVVSLGGLFGDIAVDSTLRAYTQGSPGANYIGIAQQLTATVLANVSGATAAPVPTTWTQWMDYVCGNAQGDVVYRSATGWSCLSPGVNGQVLATQGPGANPVWTPAPTIVPQAANTVYAGPVSGAAANPVFRALVGTDLPLPTPTTLGGVRSLTATTHQWINQIDVTGQPAKSQPACTDLSDFGTACQNTIGTSGATVPLLNGNNTYSGSSSWSAAMRATGVITPTALTGTVNDYNPAGLGTANVIRQDGGASDRTVTGLAAQPDGTLINFINIGSTNNITLANQNAGSLSANRFLIGSDVVLAPNKSLVLRYDVTTGAWRPYGRALDNTGVTAGSYAIGSFTVGTDGRLSAASSASTTGSGNVVLQNAPSLLSPTVNTINSVVITQPLTPATLTIAAGKTATFNNTTTFSSTDGASVAFGTGGTATYTVASGASAMGTGAIASATCATTVTATATGTATTDAIAASFNADPTAVTGYIPSVNGMLTIIAWPTSGNVNFKVCNNTTSSITPGAVTINWRVVR